MKLRCFLTIIIFLLFCSCKIMHKKIYFLCEKGIILDVVIPRYINYKTYKDLDCTNSICFLYKDSMFIYFVDGVGSFNMSNVKNINDSIFQFRYEYGELYKKINLQKGYVLYSPELPDTFELSGINKKGLYWKDIYIDGISIGYDNVPFDKKELFDSCLKNVKKKRRRN